MLTTTAQIIGDTLLVTATKDLREFESYNIDVEGEEIVKMLDDPRLRNVVVDLTGTDYCGSSALNWFLRLDKKAHARNGQLIFVGLSSHEREILHVTKLDSRWTICPSRDEAFAKLSQNVNAA
jgi:anti-anti-sigma factor